MGNYLFTAAPDFFSNRFLALTEGIIENPLDNVFFEIASAGQSTNSWTCNQN